MREKKVARPKVLQVLAPINVLGKYSDSGSDIELNSLDNQNPATEDDTLH